jgi:flagellar biosynthesis protein FliQ
VNADMALDICRRALETSILVMTPLLLAALVAGVLAGLFQAATQIQEPTLAFVPKVVAMGLAIVLCGPWMIDRLRVFTTDIIGMIGRLPR